MNQQEVTLRISEIKGCSYVVIKYAIGTLGWLEFFIGNSACSRKTDGRSYPPVIMMQLVGVAMIITLEAMKTRTEMATRQAVVGILHQGSLATRPHPPRHPPPEAWVEQ